MLTPIPVELPTPFDLVVFSWPEEVIADRQALITQYSAAPGRLSFRRAGSDSLGITAAGFELGFNLLPVAAETTFEEVDTVATRVHFYLALFGFLTPEIAAAQSTEFQTLWNLVPPIFWENCVADSRYGGFYKVGHSRHLVPIDSPAANEEVFWHLVANTQYVGAHAE